ncbi:hypothetical protein HDU97_008555 [Phlyctochytrium planicorne]|nr:hypothetical protein HDU97_008555 [Phlyctochytrium planicorne]
MSVIQEVTIDRSSTKTIYPQNSGSDDASWSVKFSGVVFVAILSAVVLGSLITAAVVFYIAGRKGKQFQKGLKDGSSPFPEEETGSVSLDNLQTRHAENSIQGRAQVPRPLWTILQSQTSTSSEADITVRGSARENQDFENDEDTGLELPRIEQIHQDPVGKWNVDQVQLWLVTLGFSEDDRRIFREMQINGSKLLELTDWILRDETSIGEGRLKNALLEIRAKFVMDGKM